jgi:excisionase family DNA binding protein
MNLEEIKKPRLYSTVEVAKFMEVGYHTLLRMVRLKKIKAVNSALSGTKPIYRFRAEDVQEYYATLSHTNSRLEDIHK